MLLFGALFNVFAALLFFGEIVVSAAVGRPLHRWKDTLSSLALHAATGFVSHFGKLFLLLLYVPLYDAVAVVPWTGHPLQWVAAFLLYEFAGYWFHRFSHETALGWAVHEPHHQSQELNLATASRVAPLRSLLDWPLLLLLAVAGVAPHALVVLYILHAAGQFWLHVRWIRSLGPLEWVINTPSHHRVHHGCQEPYGDCNYGAHLIVFDRLFGTFVPETEAPIYGVVEPPSSWSPLASVFEPFTRVWARSRHWSAWDRVQVWLRKPGWEPGRGVGRRPAPPPRVTDHRPPRLLATVVTSLSATLCLVSVYAPALASAWPKLALGALGAWALLGVGRALNGRPPLRFAETVRGLTMVGFALLLPPALLVPFVIGGLAVAVLAWAPSGAGASGRRDQQHDHDGGGQGADAQPDGHELAQGA